MMSSCGGIRPLPKIHVEMSNGSGWNGSGALEKSSGHGCRFGSHGEMVRAEAKLTTRRDGSGQGGG